MTNVVTIVEVTAVTGVVVDDAAIARAQAVIEVVSGLDLSGVFETDYPRASDRRHLKQAVTWQTAYMDSHPELLWQESGLVSASADGVSKTYKNGSSSDSVSFLAPLAALALGRLSSNRSRVVTLRSDLESRPLFQTLVEDDGYPPWEPL